MKSWAVVGAGGRLGSAVCELAQESRSVVKVFNGVVPPGETGASDLEQALQTNECSAFIDCAPAGGISQRLRVGAEQGVAMIIGTTGLADSDHSVLEQASKSSTVVLAPNFSPGVVAMELMMEEAARLVPAWPAALLDRHHQAKQDAPSGTAKHLQALWPRPVEVRSLRQGEVVGEHTLFLDGGSEELVLTHRVRSRAVFAKGAIMAAEFAEGKSSGLYTMRDVLYHFGDQ